MPAETQYPTSNNLDPAGGIIQSPKIDSAGHPTQRSIRDSGMAVNVVRTIIAANRQRQVVNSRILAKYNAERPYDSARLESEGLGWKQNFTTKPLPLWIEKVAPRFCEAVSGVKYLTDSTLSNKWQNNVEKSEKFRDVITKTIRNRVGWRTLVEDLAFDNALFGHTVAAWLDEGYTWFPKAFQQAENFLPDGCKQAASNAQFVVLKEMYLPHELFAYIKDRETAEELGWNIEETIKAINAASPAQIRDLLNIGGTIETWYQNAIRELTIGVSYMAGASVCTVYTLLVREVTGKVSHYRLAGAEMSEIFTKLDRFDGMEDCMSFFAFQKGNGTMHGSKGIGRDLYELAGMIDRTRNEVVDRSILSGKILVQGDVKRLHTFKMNVIGCMALIPRDWDLREQKIDGDIEPFLKLDAYLALLADQLIGNTSPRQFGGERTTKAEVDLFAAREEETKDVRITRFLEQFVAMVRTMQKRICDPDTLEEDAKAAQKELLEHMTRAEIEELRMQPVASTIRDLTPAERQMTSAFCTEKKGNPLYNQRALEVEDGTARVGSDFVDRVLLPTNDPTEQAEQSRLQQMELALIMQGQPVPVSPRDNHEIHLSILMPIAEQQASAMMEGQSHTAIFETLVAHINEHANNWEAQGAPKDKIKPVLDFLKKAGPEIANLHALDAQAQQLQQQSMAHDAEGHQIMSSVGPPPPEAQP
jgi:hypothetical protein